ncbi:MAG: hypothetical protein P1V97_32480 [Planctomycetota bacterium]|nr:hypothetical protein [Planctomycetota bacterium]
MRKTGAILTAALSLCLAACSSLDRSDNGTKINPGTGSEAPENVRSKPYIKNGQVAYTAPKTSSDTKKKGAKKGRRKGRKKPRPKPTPKSESMRTPYTGGAYSETQRTVASRGPQIVLPTIFDSVVTNLDKPLPKKQKVACVVVEGSYLRKEKTRGICKVLRNQNSNNEVVSWGSLKQSQTLNSLMTLARSQSIDLLVILEKRQQRSFVILDTRNAAVLCHSTKFRQSLVPGDSQLLQLHGKICKAWTTQ